MCLHTRLLAGLLGLVVGLLSLDHARSYLEKLVSHPGEEIPTAQAQRQLEALLTYRQIVYRQRIEAKRRVVSQVMAGELTLFEAGAWFRFLNETPPGFTCECRHVPGDSEEEKACRQVILWAEDELRWRGLLESAADLSARLEKQLAAHQAEHGRVVLPEL
jgi:hypothetical protein